MGRETVETLNAPRNERGFTLLELMITVVVLAILAAIAFPNFRTTMRRNNVSTQVNGLIAGLQYARSEAITSRALVSLCPRVVGASASDATCAADNSNFDAGWIVYSTTTAGTPFDSTDKDQVLLQVTPTPNSVSIRNNPAAVVTFNARGQLSSTQDFITFSLCSKPSPGQAAPGDSSAQVPGKTVTMAASGRAASTDIVAGGSCSP